MLLTCRSIMTHTGEKNIFVFDALGIPVGSPPTAGALNSARPGTGRRWPNTHR